MFESINIQNFRLFRDFKMEGLARVNLIVGKNNTGKTGLLQALNILAQWPPSTAFISEFFKALELREETSFIESESGRLRVYHLSDLFSGHQIQLNSQIDLQGVGSPSLHLRILAARKEADKSNGFQGIDEIPSHLFITPHPPGTLGQAEIPINSEGSYVDTKRTIESEAFNPVASHYIPLQGIESYYLSKLWDRIQLTPKEDKVVQMLQILESSVQGIRFLAADTGAIVRLREQNPVRLGSLGDGMYRILAIGMTLVTAENAYLLVDEIDTGLHYSVVTDMWQLVMETAERLNVQVFATTHSWDCVRSFAEALEMQENKNVGTLFRLERNNEQIEAVKYTAEDLAFVISQNIQNLEVR